MENSASLREQMFSLIAQWEQSGLSQKSFCEKHQFPYHRFHYWYKRYRKVSDQPSGEEPATFVPLKVDSGACHTEVVMPGGVRIIFHQPVTASYLIQLTR